MCSLSCELGSVRCELGSVQPAYYDVSNIWNGLDVIHLIKQDKGWAKWIKGPVSDKSKTLASTVLLLIQLYRIIFSSFSCTKCWANILVCAI